MGGVITTADESMVEMFSGFSRQFAKLVRQLRRLGAQPGRPWAGDVRDAIRPQLDSR